MNELQRKIKPPHGVSIETFRTICLAAHLIWQSHNAKPTAPLIGQVVKSVSPKKLNKIIETDEFALAMQLGGIPWKEIDALSDRQMLAIIEVANPLSQRNLETALKAAGTNYKEWNEWRQNPIFEQYYQKMVVDQFEKYRPEMERALMQNAVAGKLDSIKYVNELTGRHNPQQQQVENVQLLMTKLVEFVQEELDQEALARVAAKMAMFNISPAKPSTPVGVSSQIKELYT